ncbi:MFS general substrate transporter [Xylariaceae sp. FL0662B]|nr:MFS general substrate transporter [Xylariaceae sp. FL0662B]
MAETEKQAPARPWMSFFRRNHDVDEGARVDKKSTWNMGILNDMETIEVPGSVLLLAKGRNEPLGLRNTPARTSHSSLPTGYYQEPRPQPAPEEDDKKKTKDGQIILDPQPDDSRNDPLNWPTWRRDSSLISLGLYCMVGGGITPLIAAGFTDVANDYHVNVSEVSLTTGLYMMGLGIGSVIFSPTAILYGKRPVYLFSAVLFILSAVWCALSPNFASLLLARIFQGIAVSPVECLPSATIAEVFFLHERAYRIGVYTLLLLSGKNLIPLVSAAIMERLGWRWVFWIVAMVVGLCGSLLFLFVPETFWDRSPIPRSRRHPKRPSLFSRRSSARQIAKGTAADGEKPPLDSAEQHTVGNLDADSQSIHLRPSLFSRKSSARQIPKDTTTDGEKPPPDGAGEKAVANQDSVPYTAEQRHRNVHVGFAPRIDEGLSSDLKHGPDDSTATPPTVAVIGAQPSDSDERKAAQNPAPASEVSPPDVRDFSSPYGKPRSADDHFGVEEGHGIHFPSSALNSDTESEKIALPNLAAITTGQAYTHALRNAPPKSFTQQLKLHHGRLNQDKWWKAAIRPLILFSYPSVLWSAAVYSCSIGWLIVISESVAVIYREGRYHFNALSTGLIYISPFVGGVLGTAVAGKVSDIIVRAMARRNGGLYEPEFRLVMAAPVAITTVIGLMGFGWSADENDPWIVPTIFFGIVSFGCSLGSTTSITFCVDSYRQYAGEALVTLNFSKNIFHGLVFSLFVTEWLTDAGAKTVYIWIGIIQLIVLLFTIPMYIYGKRARMWTVRNNFMEKY